MILVGNGKLNREFGRRNLAEGAEFSGSTLCIIITRVYHNQN